MLVRLITERKVNGIYSDPITTDVEFNYSRTIDNVLGYMHYTKKKRYLDV